MTDERYKELMAQVGLPNSRSLLQALQQCAMESALEERSKLMTEYNRLYMDGKTPTAGDVAKVFAELNWGCHSSPNATSEPQGSGNDNV